MIKPAVLALLFSIIACLMKAQQVSNIHAAKKGRNINIYYDLSGEDSFEIKVYFSQDGGMTWEGLKNPVAGAIGQQQIAGFNKKIKWDIRTYPEKRVGDLNFQVEASTLQTNSIAGTFTDERDGKIYKWVKIGNQVWMEENLNFSMASGSWCYNDQQINCKTYGRLYDWKTANTACPEGWKLPSDEEWLVLTSYLGGENVAGGKMKESGVSHWQKPNSGATNISGFAALPAGFRSGNSYFYSMRSYVYFWSSSEVNATRAWKRGLYYNYGNVSHLGYGKEYGFSVRCIKH